MAMSDKREEAERLYVTGLMSCPAIAEQLGVDKGTVYRWKNEAAEKGAALDWETKRSLYNMSPKEFFSMYAESVKAFIIELKKNPDKLADPKIADAIVKHFSVLQCLDPRKQYLGVAIDLVKVINNWLGEHQPELKEKMKPFWDEIYTVLKDYSTKKEIV